MERKTTDDETGAVPSIEDAVVRKPRVRPARFFRTLVAAAVAAAAPAAGCYDSTTDEDVPTDAADGDRADASDASDNWEMLPAYGIPDTVEAGDEAMSGAYGVPDYGASDYGVP